VHLKGEAAPEIVQAWGIYACIFGPALYHLHVFSL
jgi:hypothetical protein